MKKGTKTGLMWIIASIVIYAIWYVILMALSGSTTQLAWSGNYQAALSAASTYAWVASFHWIVVIICVIMGLYGLYHIVKNL